MSTAERSEVYPVIVQLVEPDGTLNLRCTIEYAVEWCRKCSGWTWRHVDEGPLP